MSTAVDLQMIVTDGPQGRHAVRIPMLVSFRFPIERLMPAVQSAGAGAAERVML